MGEMKYFGSFEMQFLILIGPESVSYMAVWKGTDMDAEVTR
jgi:hypothetical protein